MLYILSFTGYFGYAVGVLVLLISTLISWIVWAAISSYFSPLNAIPNVPNGHPVLKHFLTFKSQIDIDKVLMKWCGQFRETGLFRYNPLLGIRVCIFREDYVKQVLLTNKYQRPDLLKKAMPSVGNGLFSSNGKEHAWQRKIINPAFTHAAIKSFVQLFDRNTDNLVQVWKRQVQDSPHNVAEVLIAQELNHLTLDVIGQAAFGYNFDTLISGENDVSEAFESILCGSVSLRARVLKMFIPFFEYLPFETNIKSRKAKKLTHDIVWEIIKERRRVLNEEEEECELSDLLTILMKAQDVDSGRTMTDELLHNEIYTFMLAGHETTSVALTWTLYLLAIHPEHQEKARAEVRNLLGDSSSITLDIIDKLEYVTAVIKESLRMYPPVLMSVRCAVRDNKLGPYDIPKGTMIVIPICAIHYMEEYWEEPFKYKPERFLTKADQEHVSPKAHCFMPFSAGPRNCIGSRFALSEMKVAVAKLLLNFNFNIAADHPEVHTKVALTMKPEPSPRLKISLVT